MAVPVHVPRVNNNDDQVKLVELKVAVGDQVMAGQILGAVETDKATLDVESPSAGFVLAVRAEVDSVVQVGHVLLWLGSTPDEAIPVDPSMARTAAAGAEMASPPTAKARALLAEYGLNASAVPASGNRLTADDVLQHVARKGLSPRRAMAGVGASSAKAAWPQPDAPGQWRDLASHERGMLQTVTWQREAAVPGYVEVSCDHQAWEAHAAAFAAKHQSLLSPLLPLLAWRLVELVSQSPRFNATLLDERRYEFSQVNLGFTVQAAEVLYLAVIRNAAALGPQGFVDALVDAQRRAAAHALTPQELQGATIGFSSMSRWKVERHVPILAPHTALMVAHTVGASGQGVLGATYDHRVLHGGDVAALLRKLSAPPKSQS